MQWKKKIYRCPFSPHSVLVFLNLHVIPLPMCIFVLFYFRFFFFGYGPFLKFFQFVIMLFLFYLCLFSYFLFCFFVVVVVWESKLTNQGLEGEVLTTGPPGMSWFFFFFKQTNLNVTLFRWNCFVWTVEAPVIFQVC